MTNVSCSIFARAAGVGALAIVIVSATLFAADTPKPKKSRLPQYYGQVVTPEQRTAILAVADEYAPKLAELEAKLLALRGEADGKMRALLSSEQQKKLDQLIAEGKAKRDKKPDNAQASPKPAKNPAAGAGS